eukprot:CAMPEP_0170548460 /NCGR_PEP_ID=MMETSP0211-20121228/6790_1 /TAXON_ID=311385 /ORGANISM="Pseudokeronopsis sp., Strain OXSARD2" /LENGTH=89 /DNA_ID=CAMNT_0010854041 /DNA_START=493 /DNA_END=762 /DNA_ORIENTATION=-
MCDMQRFSKDEAPNNVEEEDVNMKIDQEVSHPLIQMLPSANEPLNLTYSLEVVKQVNEGEKLEEIEIPPVQALHGQVKQSSEEIEKSNN